ncbi:hypothetical protein DFH11DRAFT_1721811 [Phellopilus nigrolimitatus]|nr:hypothetical protein DFH11DRAFT_1721811 [Phellopilus nigrolimitatus]
MVSPLWNASGEGDLAQVEYILKDASTIDIEIKGARLDHHETCSLLTTGLSRIFLCFCCTPLARSDDNGATPLVQAVKSGHGHVVRALLHAGADPSVHSSYGSPEQLTTDATILELLATARAKNTQPDSAAAAYFPPDGYSQEYPTDPAKAYYCATARLLYFYPPPPPPAAGQPPDSAGGNNLPPPEIARLIPCRYFPACRYGPSCIFAHPQGPYFQGALPPPAQYPAPYEPIAQLPYGGYYAMPYPPNGVPSGNPMSPPIAHQSPALQPNHMRTNSEIMSPMQTPFSPTGGPPPMPFTLPVPVTYPPPGQMTLPQIPVGMPPLPPPQQPAVHTAQPNGVHYPPTSPVVQPAAMHRRDPSMGISQNVASSQVLDQSATNHMQSMPPQQDAYANGSRPPPRDGFNHARRGSVRRLSGMGPSRKPPCAFFPSGRCRNGEACRFPHVLPDPNESAPGHFSSKFGPRVRPHAPPADEQLHEKLSALSLRTDAGPAAPQVNGHANGHAVQSNGIPRTHNNFKTNHAVNGIRHDKRNNGPRPPQSQQRVPNAEDFPVLSGSITPPARSPGAPPLNGPTAAQVLQAPPPVRRDSAKSQSQAPPLKDPDVPIERVSSPTTEITQKEMNGTATDHHAKGTNGINGINGHDIKPLSFATVATVAATAPESVNTVSVSA